MTDALTIRLLQFNPQVGNIAGNADAICQAMATARDQGVDVLVTPELALTGYPPEDLLLRPAFQRQVEAALARIREASDGLTVIVGTPTPIVGPDGGDDWALGHHHAGPPRAHNSALVFSDQALLASYHKQSLPNYQVFDERRYFEPGHGPVSITVKGHRLGLMICEDVWRPALVEASCAQGLDLLVVLNASPFAEGKHAERLAHVRHRALANQCPIAYVNLHGGQDELVFDGGSFVVNALGQCTGQAPWLTAAVLDVRLSRDGVVGSTVAETPTADAFLYQALVIGLREYCAKTGFQRLVLGLSGGIDSALTLAIAVDALGGDRVHAVMMPYHYTKAMSVEDAKTQTEILGCQFSIIPIAPMVEAFLAGLAPFFKGLPLDTTEENLQSRCRGVVLMALSNKTGALVITTGNKSEMAVGYATLYGDMAGGYAVLKDVWKTRVYALARYVNRDRVVIPTRVITRPPSAELAPGQEDTDTLPPYDQLDAMLAGYIEQDLSVEALIDAGFAEDDVRRMCRLVDQNEYKRRQSAIGTRVTSRGFGRDRRYPVAHRFRD